MGKQQLNWETDFEFLKQKVCKPDELQQGFPNYNEADLESLRSGEAAFIWKSPLAISAEEAVDMARQAALEMAPEPGQVIRAAALFLSVNPDGGHNLKVAETIVQPIQQLVGETTSYFFAPEFCHKGTHFILATAEGKKEIRTRF